MHGDRHLIMSKSYLCRKSYYILITFLDQQLTCYAMCARAHTAPRALRARSEARRRLARSDAPALSLVRQQREPCISERAKRVSGLL